MLDYTNIKFEVVTSRTPTLCRGYSVVAKDKDDNILSFVCGGYRQLSETPSLLCKPATMYKFQANKIVASLNKYIEAGYSSIDFLDAFVRTRFN